MHLQARLHLVNFLGRFRIELEGGEDDAVSAWGQLLRFFPGSLHLALFERRVLRAEGDDNAVSG
jgi:hypothetical protein